MSSCRSILIVDNDPALRAALAAQITLSGDFVADEAGSAVEAEQKLASTYARYDAILLDVGPSNADGRNLCTKLRRDGRRMPIIMLSSANAEADVVRGLEAGANDYIARPFRLPELLARVRAQIRGFDNSDDAVFTIGHYMFRPAAKVLLDKARHRRIPLADKEVAILRYLYRAGGKPVSQQEMLSEVWSYNNAAQSHTLRTHIYRLRQKIEVDPFKPRLLLSTAEGAYKVRLQA